MKKRIISIFLVVTLLVGILPQTSWLGSVVAATDVVITMDGQEVEQISFDEDETRELVAKAGTGADSYRWQILMDAESDVWVNISGMDKESARVSNSLIKGLSDMSGSAYLRCVAAVGETEYFSQPVCVTVRQKAVLPSESSGGGAGAVSPAAQSGAAMEEEASEEPVNEEPVNEEAASEEAVSEEVAGEESAVETVAGEEPVGEKTAGAEPAREEPADETTAGGEPANGEPESTESAGTEPADVTPSGEKTAGEKAAAEESAKVESADGNPASAEIVGAKSEDAAAKTEKTADENISGAEPQAAAKQTAALEDTANVAAPEAKTEPQAAQKAPRKAPAGGATRGTELATITINYLDYKTADPLFQPFVATLEKGTAYKNSLLSPTYLGFEPVYNANEISGAYHSENTKDSADAIEIDITSISDDLTYNVYYIPIDVTYAARYFFQNIYDDKYTEDTSLYRKKKAKTGTIITDDELTDGIANREGYTILYHYPDQVAADGSTVFELYYDRNYYLMKFDMNGGYGVEPVYARFETPFIVNTPTRHGYVFDGWDEFKDTNGDGAKEYDGVADELPKKIPAENREYKAIWTTANTTVTYALWRENADDDGYSFWANITKAAESGSPVESADLKGELPNEEEYADREFFLFDNNNNRIEKKIVEGDGSTIVNVYYTRKAYNLKFFYARSRGNIYQICGFTNNFSDPKRAGETRDLNILLDENKTEGWTTVTNLPTLKNPGKYKNVGSEPHGKYTYYYVQFTAKYNQNIYDLWPLTEFDKATRTTQRHGTYDAFFGAWGPEACSEYINRPGRATNDWTIKGKQLYFNKELMIKSSYIDNDNRDVNFLAFWTNAHTSGNWDATQKWTYHIYKENAAGEQVISETIESYDTNNIHDNQTEPQIAGYIFDHKVYHTPKLEISFYYRPQEYQFTFMNHQEEIYNSPISTKFGADLPQPKDNVPPYPKTLEENAYEFVGWFKDQYGREPFIFGQAMPASNVIAYARWVPKKHTVRFFDTYEKMTEFEKTADVNLINHNEKVPHGTVVSQVPQATPLTENGVTYAFGGWFYMNNGAKTAYTPLDAPVTKDINVFADWGSHTAQPFKISYVVQGTDIKVADDTTGYGYQGRTRTFTPKAGKPYNQLYSAPDNYNEGYFPTLASHSMTLKYENDKSNLENNLFTFEYVRVNNVDYTVRHVYGNESVKEVKKTTSSAVETARFEPKPGYVPDAFYKRIVLAVQYNPDTGQYESSASNVVTFYYTKSTDVAFYAVHYMMQKQDTAGTDFKIDGTGDFEENDAHLESTGDINTKVNITAPTFTGFTLIPDKNITKVNGVESGPHHYLEITVTENGTELYLFYARNKYKYKAYFKNYYDQDVDIERSEVSADEYEYGSVVDISGKSIAGWTLVSAPVSLLIRADKNEEADNNEVTFYYREDIYTVEYIVAGEGGSVNLTTETRKGTETFQGSIPTPNTGYAFEGWYVDADCKTRVSDQATVDSTSGKITPDMGKLDPLNTNRFYAKFEEQFGSLTIKRENGADENDEGNGAQVFVYKITNKDYPDIVVYATITGDGSVTISNLRQGNYTVEQQNQWSWRYDDRAQTGATGGTVVFEGTATNDSWLNGNSPVKVNKKGGA